VTNDLELTLGATPLYNTNSTLNAKYGVLPSQVPTVHPIIQYFGVGIGGTFNVDGTNLSQPNEVSALNMDLYTPIPIRCVPIEQDLSSSEQALYRMRVVKTIGGQQYACYYLKLLTKENSQVQYTQLNPTTLVETTYVLNYTNLNPTPPTTSTNGTSSAISSEVDALLQVNFPLLGSEINEAVSVIYGGDLRYARITEIGVYSGTDYAYTTTDYLNNPFTYTESIMTQLSLQYTFNGVDMASPTTAFNQNFSFGASNIVLL
jgi:hypothetical protein